MVEMLRFLSSTGLNDITFIVINSRQQSSQLSIKVLSDIIGNTNISLYQETDESPVWEKLEGGNKDVFIYDRCGRLTYYLPYPLSVVDPRQPILQTALLSTYFDNPCGNACEMSVQKPDIVAASTSSTKFEESFNVTEQMSILLLETLVLEAETER
ncbi:Selenoprotein Pb-like protein [Leptotrombidium deliense]|uniref:Selenoprotein Pb-like protein n=1 Tax=Leptotrombidium deliense TaxID=299467 RepID=A0A443SM45_9ACAR|nr:Selenoprotein Pb-like protein [Leptotrombidium deliense]